eukprot:TRINITY_DN15_c0_g2_i1.p1 TRINITY_DN15_c0_g2~~TRINITY_DN15_c0_g2_i1.p1  ORF type:complete len:422 (-),score=235.22 TRINITY_DN15_c0_g2_i1:1028-2293(-)
MSTQQEQIRYLRTLNAVRNSCTTVLQVAKENKLKHLTINLDKIDSVVDLIVEETKENYPNLQVPFHSRWRHIDAGNIPRKAQLENEWNQFGKVEITRRLLDLAVVSVLLDAGAGPTWRYIDPFDNKSYNRSEGLAVASVALLRDGIFANDAKSARVDAQALLQLDINRLAKGLQADDPQRNFLVGLEGRANLLRRLGESMLRRPQFFGSDSNCRPGNVYDYLLTIAQSSENQQKSISIHQLWETIIEGFQDAWPATRTQIDGVNMGDIWPCEALNNQYVVFHKLSQWLVYSLIEPLEEAQLQVQNISDMTGLAEYRNGGLLYDLGVIQIKSQSQSQTDQQIGQQIYTVDSQLIVEWRALTVALLDEIAILVRKKLGFESAIQYPLARVLQGGSWSAGRRIAYQLRPDGSPPIVIQSDGTVF